MNRAAPILMLAVLISLCTSCATTYAPRLVPGQVAHVKIVVPSEPVVDYDGYRTQKTVDVSVHDYANGCPLVEDTRTGKGFRGKLQVPYAKTTTVDVPAGRRLTFTSGWPLPGWGAQAALPLVLAIPVALATFCTSVVTFVPSPGRTYVIKFPIAPDGGKPACGATAEMEESSQTSAGPAALVAYPHVLRGSEAFQPGGLCALGAN